MEAVDVAELHHVSDLLIGCDAALGESEVLLAHLTQLQLHAQAAGHGHIHAELNRRDAVGLVVALGAHVRAHGDGGEVIELTPLDE